MWKTYLGRMVLLILAVSSLFVLYDLTEPDPNEPRWRVFSRRDYEYKEVHVDGNHVIFVSKQNAIHEYDGEIILSDHSRKIQVFHYLNDNEKTRQSHGYHRWRIYVPR